MNSDALRALPAVGAILETEPAVRMLATYRREFVVRAVREAVERARSALAAGDQAPTDAAELAQTAEDRLAALVRSGPRRVINATGVVMHTGLGRAPLPREWLVTGYCDLEIDRATGERGQRQDLLREKLRWITGAEDALVVNNNAAATLLAVDSLARGGEVIIARGQLVEIGGSFRMPDVIEASGARLIEVGTTNRVRLADYEAAVSDRTAAILVVHTSNYRIVGFTESVSVGDLAVLAREVGAPLVNDVGSGCLFDTAEVPGLERYPPEPLVRRAIEDGADLVCFSGDKLLGGPQAGVIVGRADLVARLARNPLARALRVDKLTLSALGACLGAHMLAAEDAAPAGVRLLTRSEEALRAVAEGVVEALRRRAPAAAASVEDGESAPGSGSLPDARVRSAHVHVRCARPERAARALREADPAVFCLVREGSLVLDVRTLLPGDGEDLVSALVKVLDAPR